MQIIHYGSFKSLPHVEKYSDENAETLVDSICEKSFSSKEMHQAISKK